MLDNFKFLFLKKDKLNNKTRGLKGGPIPRGHKFAILESSITVLDKIDSERSNCAITTGKPIEGQNRQTPYRHPGYELITDRQTFCTGHQVRGIKNKVRKCVDPLLCGQIQERDIGSGLSHEDQEGVSEKGARHNPEEAVQYTAQPGLP
jgi:hypothetical protein